MLGYLTQQTISFVITLFLVLTLVFFGVRALPGDPATIRGGLDASQEEIQLIRKSLGLAGPLVQQFGDYWASLARGDLGRSIREQRGVSRILSERLPVTLRLASMAFALSLVVGVGLGVVAAFRQNGAGDRLILGYTTVGLALPEFWLGFLLILLFAVELRWFPLIGYSADPTFGSFLYYLFLPALTLAIPRAAQLARLSRALLLEERRSDYVRTARSKGVRSLALVRHVAANALPGLLPLLALELGGLLTGTIVVEQVFGLPGLGLTILGAISARDYPVVQGITVLAVVIYMAINWLADLGQLIADPRLRYQ
ncbi:MAG TPA: ABC transporter permease [Trueperaceae bacterium]